MFFEFKKWLTEVSAAPPTTTPAPQPIPAPASATPPKSTGGGGGGGGSASPGGGLFGTGTAFKYTPSNSTKNAFAKTPDQWYKRDMSNKFNKGCSGLNCPKSITG